MDKIQKEDPENIYYPLCKETFEDTSVFYHGSNENYSENVEKNGFITKWRPYDRDKIRKFAGICNEIDDWLQDQDRDHKAETGYEKMVNIFHNWHHTIGSSYIETSIESITFTNQYWLAMQFSQKQGGETIRAAVGLAKAVCELLPDWKGKINNQLKEKAENSTKEILDLYKKIFDEHVPCIYVARLDSDLDNYSKPDYGKPSSERKDVETKRDIPKESILARVVYPNGITESTSSFSGGKPIALSDIDLASSEEGTYPLPWERNAWEKYRKDPFNALGTHG